MPPQVQEWRVETFPIMELLFGYLYILQYIFVLHFAILVVLDSSSNGFDRIIYNLSYRHLCKALASYHGSRDTRTTWVPS